MDQLAEIEIGASAAWFSDELAAVACSSAGARGKATMVERSAAHGTMPPLLRREVAETYRVLDGEIVFFVGEDVVWARPGDVVVAPAGVARTFRVDSDEGARWLVVTHVCSVERFSDFGRAVSAPLADPAAGWPSESERAAVAAMGADNGIELLGPPGALPGRLQAF
jgi:mannose-6-phosphate isomerase-like protein (cupin superfamily)